MPLRLPGQQPLHGCSSRHHNKAGRERSDLFTCSKPSGWATAATACPAVAAAAAAAAASSTPIFCELFIKSLKIVGEVKIACEVKIGAEVKIVLR